jgi:CubicO group peptidase (beta-lactamase class C family)
VGVEGELVWADARGYADIESQSLATPDTVYAIGSVSKPLTGVLTTLLWQEGVLDIDTDVREFTPAFPEKRHKVTLRQLLSHQAGIRHYEFDWTPPAFSESSLNRDFASTEESLSLFADDALLQEAARTEMFTARTLPSGELNPQHYGLGWRIGGLVITDDKTGEEKIITLINHGGTRAGSTAILMIVPDHEIVVAMTANTVGRGASGPITGVAAKIAREFIAARSR